MTDEQRRQDQALLAPDVRQRSQRVGAVVLLAGLALLGINGSWSIRHCAELRTARAGELATDFTLPRVDDGALTLASLRGQVVVLDFWASWCKPCVRKFPALERLQQQLGPRGLRVLAVNIEGDMATARRFMQRRQQARADRSPSPVMALLDDGTVAQRYGVQRIPHLVVVGRDGLIRHVQAGSGGTKAMYEAVHAALQHERR